MRASSCVDAGAPQLADVVREARILVGWTQRDLATPARTSQATIWRIEGGSAARLDMLVVERVLGALGIRASLDLDARHLDDRRSQHDGVHARLTGYVARRLGRLGWQTATEVPLGDGPPRGWIDLLAYRPEDRAMLVEETKTEIHDLGALQRSLAFYEREAWLAARRMGWRPRRVAVLLVALDAANLGRRLADNRDLVARAFPATIGEVAAWLADPRLEPPLGWGIAMADPAARGATWLRPTSLGTRPAAARLRGLCGCGCTPAPSRSATRPVLTRGGVTQCAAELDGAPGPAFRASAQLG
jgi:transcriptional regulator with XRE-family HTH domain